MALFLLDIRATSFRSPVFNAHSPKYVIKSHNIRKRGPEIPKRQLILLKGHLQSPTKRRVIVSSTKFHRLYRFALQRSTQECLVQRTDRYYNEVS